MPNFLMAPGRADLGAGRNICVFRQRRRVLAVGSGLFLGGHEPMMAEGALTTPRGRVETIGVRVFSMPSGQIGSNQLKYRAWYDSAMQYRQPMQRDKPG